MDSSRFDGITKLLGASIARRGALGALAALGTSGAVGIFGAADAKGKGKGKGKGKNKGTQRRCKAKSKPACSQSSCQAAVCDRRRGKWSCRNKCAGTSTPKCLGGQCVDACDEELGLFECGDNCCNPLVHSECCQGTCCGLGQRCEGGKCVPRCQGWEGVSGGRLEYTITYERRAYSGDYRMDQTTNASANLECYYNAVYGEVICGNVAGTIAGTHTMFFQDDGFWEEEEGSGSEEMGSGTIPGLNIHLPASDENPATHEFTLATIEVAGTYWNSHGETRARTFPIPDNWLMGWFDTDLKPLPALPGVLIGVQEWSHPNMGDNVARFTWTFTPDEC